MVLYPFETVCFIQTQSFIAPKHRFEPENSNIFDLYGIASERYYFYVLYTYNNVFDATYEG